MTTDETTAAQAGLTARAVVTHLDTVALPTAQEWQTMAQVAEALVRSGLLPAHIKTPQAALAIMLKGRELRIPAMHALSNIVVVNGKPTSNAELMSGLVFRDHGDDALHIEETTPERCTVSYKRRSWSERRSYSFTMADAQRAGLATSQTWQKYPQAMLRARCISAVARMAFPDSIAGMYSYEELGVPVQVEDDGSVVVDQAALPAPSTSSSSSSSSQPHRRAPVLDRVAEEMATAAEADAGDALPGQGRPPKTASVDGIRRNELFTSIQALVGAGVKLDTGERWKELARTHEMVEPARSADMTVGWLEELYRRMRERQAQPQTQPEPHIAQAKRGQDKREQTLAGWIAAAPDEATLTQLRADVMGALKSGSLTDKAAEALLEAVAGRSGELDLYPQATDGASASDLADAEAEDAAAAARAETGLARAGDAVRAVSRRGQGGAEEAISEATVSG